MTRALKTHPWDELEATFPPRRSSGSSKENANALHLLKSFLNARCAVREAITKGQPEIAEHMDEVAWGIVREADPVRVSFVERVIGISNPTVREWAQAGLLEDFGGSPRRVGLESVARTFEIVLELREAGVDRDLMAAVLSRLELEQLQKDSRFTESLKQMRRGERAA